MIGIKTSNSEFNDLRNSIKSIQKTINDPGINLARAANYREKTIEFVQNDSLGLDKISDATKKISGFDHPRFWERGELVKAMGVKKIKGGGAEAGYFGNDENIKQQNEPITTTQWAILQHRGYKIPLTGEKGERVRRFLAIPEISIFPRKEKEFMEVKPNPFMIMSLKRYEITDVQIASKFIQSMMEIQ